MVRSGDWLVVAGSVPSGARPGWWRTLFLGLGKKGVRILVDGKGQLLREAMQAGVEWAKANLAEAEETMQKKGASRCLEAMRNLSCGRSCLSITQGSRGLVLQAGKQRFPVRAPKIRLRDATGSGDVVSAALVYGIRKGWEIEKVAGFAVWAGSEKAARRDAVVRRLKG
jgi:1-phosphofructokinase